MFWGISACADLVGDWGPDTHPPEICQRWILCGLLWKGEGSRGYFYLTIIYFLARSLANIMYYVNI